VLDALPRPPLPCPFSLGSLRCGGNKEGSQTNTSPNGQNGLYHLPGPRSRMTRVYLWVSESRGLYCGRPGVEAFALQASGGALPVRSSKASMCLLHVCVLVVHVRLPQAVSVGLHAVTPVAEFLPRSSLFACFFFGCLRSLCFYVCLRLPVGRLRVPGLWFRLSRVVGGIIRGSALMHTRMMTRVRAEAGGVLHTKRTMMTQ